MKYLLYGLVFTQAFLISALLIPLIIKLAYKWNVVDRPGQRKIHHIAKPLMGGVGIFSAFFITVVGNIIGFSLLLNHPLMQNQLQSLVKLFPFLNNVLPRLIVIIAGGFMIHLLGLLDDIFKGKLSWKLKFLIQFLIALLVAIFGVRTEFMPGHTLDIIITTIWIVGITNGFNLLDNLDGLTAGISIIAALLFFTVAVLQGQVFFALVLMALAGASMGFLLYNFHPSKLFMGDSGSLFLGFMFGSLTVMGSYVVNTSVGIIPVIMPILILSIPLYDTFSVMFIRWSEGRPLFIGDKCHFSHRLLELGMGHRAAVIFIYLVCLCVGSVAILLPWLSTVGCIIILVQAVIIYTLITLLIMIGRRKNIKNEN